MTFAFDANSWTAWACPLAAARCRVAQPSYWILQNNFLDDCSHTISAVLTFACDLINISTIVALPFSPAKCKGVHPSYVDAQHAVKKPTTWVTFLYFFSCIDILMSMFKQQCDHYPQQHVEESIHPAIIAIHACLIRTCSFKQQVLYLFNDVDVCLCFDQHFCYFSMATFCCCM